MTTITFDGNMAVIKVKAGRLDAAAGPAFKADLQSHLNGQTNRALLDMHDVTFMDSTGLGVLVSLLKMLGKDGALAVAGAQPSVRRLFELTRLDTVFRLTDSVGAAREALGD